MSTPNQFFIGIDVSKLHLDAALMVVENHRKGAISTERFENNAARLLLSLDLLHACKKSVVSWFAFNCQPIGVVENVEIVSPHVLCF